MSAKELLQAATALEALALASDSLALVRKKKRTARDFIRTGARAVVGTALIKAQADAASRL